MGQLGDGGFVGRLEPMVASELPPMKLLAVGQLHTCASDGTDVYCWGDDGSGQLGRPGADTHDCERAESKLPYACAPTPGPAAPAE